MSESTPVPSDDLQRRLDEARARLIREPAPLTPLRRYPAHDGVPWTDKLP
jgi:hypothetical protein